MKSKDGNEIVYIILTFILLYIGCFVFLFYGLLHPKQKQEIRSTPEVLPKSTRECEIIILPTEKIYMHRYGTVEDPYREDLHGEIRCSCVRYARSLGVELPYDLEPKDLEPNTEIEIGAVAIFSDNHIGVGKQDRGQRILGKGIKLCRV